MEDFEKNVLTRFYQEKLKMRGNVIYRIQKFDGNNILKCYKMLVSF